MTDWRCWWLIIYIEKVTNMTYKVSNTMMLSRLTHEHHKTFTIGTNMTLAFKFILEFYLCLVLMRLNISIWWNIWRSFNDIIFLCDDLFLLFNFMKCILIHIIYLIIVIFWLDGLSTQWEVRQGFIFQFMNSWFCMCKFLLSLLEFAFERFFFLKMSLTSLCH